MAALFPGREQQTQEEPSILLASRTGGAVAVLEGRQGGLGLGGPGCFGGERAEMAEQ